MPLDPHTKKHCKRCPGGCRRWVNKSIPMCGDCADKRAIEALALANGVELIKARNQAIYLSNQHKKNIGEANKRRALQAGDNS